MLFLERLTTEYVPLEDRIRITGEISKNRTVFLWLTQRMLFLLLPNLFNWLEKQGVTRRKSKNSDSPLLSYVEQTFAQEAAVAGLEVQDQTPVKGHNAEDNLLVHSIDITTGETAIQIGFKSNTIQEELRLINLTMECDPLRQWLHIVYTQSRDGGWPLHNWPEWMHENEDKQFRNKGAAH